MRNRVGNILVSLVNTELDMYSVQGENGLYALLISWGTQVSLGLKGHALTPTPQPIMTSETEDKACPLPFKVSELSDRRHMEKNRIGRQKEVNTQLGESDGEMEALSFSFFSLFFVL